MIAALRRKTVMLVFDSKGILSFNFTALTLSIRYEVLRELIV